LDLRGQAYCHLGEAGKAIVDFQSAAELEPEKLYHKLRYLGALAASGQTETSEAELNLLLGDSPTPGHLLVEYGMALVGTGLLQQMESAVARAAEFDSAIESVMYYNLGCGYARAGSKDQSFVALNRSIDLGEGRLQMFANDVDLIQLRDDPRFDKLLAKLKWSESFQQGRAKYQAEDYSAAIEDFTRASELNPNYGLLWHWRGLAYRANGQSAEAEADFNRYLDELNRRVEVHPDDWQAVNRRGLALNKLMRWDDAITDFTRALELAPDKPVLYRHRATSFLEQQQWALAADDLAPAIEMRKADWQAHYQLALTRLGAGDVNAYREACRGMLVAFGESQDPLTANFVAWTCGLAPEALEDFEPALKLARLAAEAQSGSLQNQNTLGTLLMRAGEIDEAIQVLTEVAEHLDKPDASPNTSPAYTWYAIALAYQQSGSDEQAQEYLNKASESTDAVLSDEANSPAWNRRLTLELLRDEANDPRQDKSWPTRVRLGVFNQSTTGRGCSCVKLSPQLSTGWNVLLYSRHLRSPSHLDDGSWPHVPSTGHLRNETAVPVSTVRDLPAARSPTHGLDLAARRR
jgi:tetratricopeptide (TPR) repeat protein